MRPVFAFRLMAVCFFLSFAPAAWAAEGEESGKVPFIGRIHVWPTAADMLILLPATIFENTPAGLSEAEKYELLDKRVTEFWGVDLETDSTLIITSRPFNDTQVTIQLLYAENGDIIVAAGARGEGSCALELWRFDIRRRMVPLALPEEPRVGEFFIPGRKLPAGLDPSIMICLDGERLEALPVFWSDKGIVDVPLDNRIHYNWNGHDFVKEVLPAK